MRADSGRKQVVLWVERDGDRRSYGILGAKVFVKCHTKMQEANCGRVWASRSGPLEIGGSVFVASADRVSATP